jgi:hypothetical protein
MAPLEMSGKSTEMQLLEEHGPTNTIRLRLEQQLLPILVKGVNNVKVFKGEKDKSSKPPPKQQMRTLQRLM